MQYNTYNIYIVLQMSLVGSKPRLVDVVFFRGLSDNIEWGLGGIITYRGVDQESSLK